MLRASWAPMSHFCLWISPFMNWSQEEIGTYSSMKINEMPSIIYTYYIHSAVYDQALEFEALLKQDWYCSGFAVRSSHYCVFGDFEMPSWSHVPVFLLCFLLCTFTEPVCKAALIQILCQDSYYVSFEIVSMVRILLTNLVPNNIKCCQLTFI